MIATTWQLYSVLLYGGDCCLFPSTAPPPDVFSDGGGDCCLFPSTAPPPDVFSDGGGDCCLFPSTAPPPDVFSDGGCGALGQALGSPL